MDNNRIAHLVLAVCLAVITILLIIMIMDNKKGINYLVSLHANDPNFTQQEDSNSSGIDWSVLNPVIYM